MTDESSIADISPPKTTLNDDKTSLCQQLMSRLQALNSLTATTAVSKKQIWLEFLSLWFDILQNSVSDVPSCYKECSRLPHNMINKTSFYQLKRETDVARQTFFTCLSLLNLSHIKDYLKSTNENGAVSTNQAYCTQVNFMLSLLSEALPYLPLLSTDEEKIIEKSTELFTLLIEYVDLCMPIKSKTTEQKDYKLDSPIMDILSVLWNLLDRTVFVPTFLKCDLPKKVVLWLAQARMLLVESRQPLIHIALNISWHDEGADELNKYRAIAVIKQYQKKYIEDDSRLIVFGMVLALLSTPEQLKNDAKDMKIVLDKLLQLVINADINKSSRYNGFHISEPLGVLVKMFVVEEQTLDYTLCRAETEPPSDMHSTISLFISLFFKFSNALKGDNGLEQFTLTAILNILWSISFHPIYGQELLSDEKLIDTIKTFTDDHNQQEIVEQYRRRSMESIKSATYGILHNLNRKITNDIASDEKIVTHDIRESNSMKGKSDKPMIMISYCHKNDSFCTELFNLLTTHNDAFDIWIDRTHLQGVDDLWELIAYGIERSSIVVSLISSQYFESKSCRQEFVYAADSQKKKIVPVLLEKFEPKGWLGK
ncbi:unnamed protein product [Rotaria socialis]|uniref:TIR domain-containing protein n=3 Tax=Rotaria socialis TaxID=392032 RepID=A0A821T5B2_9BILA|nr:unnamed protein product [Rotaria socialis]CAF4869817.1 unnamed protein product [Rotaria socialis]